MFFIPNKVPIHYEPNSVLILQLRFPYYTKIVVEH